MEVKELSELEVSQVLDKELDVLGNKYLRNEITATQYDAAVTALCKFIREVV